MIEKTVSKNVVNVGFDLSGGGGIANLFNEYQKIIIPFYHIRTSTNTRNPFYKLLIFGWALILLVYYRICKGVKLAHFHGASHTSFRRKYLLGLWAGILGYKTIFHLHGGDFHRFVHQLGKQYIKKRLSRFTALVVLSKSWKNYLETLTTHKDIRIIHNIVTPHPQEQTPSGKKTPGTLNLLFLGALNEKKGIYDLMNVLENKKSEWKEKVHLCVCGGKERAEIEKFQSCLQSLNLSDMVEYAGWVENGEKIRRLTECDVIILPSYYEGIPIALLDAMEYGKGIIATCVGGITDIVTDGENGILIEPGKAGEIEQAIEIFLKNPLLLKKYGNNSRKRIPEYYPESAEKSLYSLYSHLLCN